MSTAKPMLYPVEFFNWGIRIAWRILAVIVLTMGAVVAQAEEGDDPAQPTTFLTETGTSFTVGCTEIGATMSVTTTEPVTANLTLLDPDALNLDLRGAEGTTVTDVTISGLSVGATLYMHTDRLQDVVTFETDGSGSHTFSIDLTERHLVMIRPEISTIYITDTGITPSAAASFVDNGDGTKTVTLLGDITDAIQIEGTGITLDGAGYTITAPATTNGIYVAYSPDAVIKDVTVSGAYYAVQTYNCPGIRIENNDLSGTRYGVYIDDLSTDAVVSSNDIRTTGGGTFPFGVFAYFTRGLTVDNNTFGGVFAQYAVWLNQTTDPVVSDNVVVNTASGHQYGIRAEGSHGGVITRNVLTDTHFGILAYSCNGMLIQGNRVTSYRYPLYFNVLSGRPTGTRNSQVFENRFTSVIENALTALTSPNPALNLIGATDNEIWHNDFISLENAEPCVTGSGTSVFTSPGCGNYWNTYFGIDDDANGCGDDVYAFGCGDMASQDLRPYMTEGGWETIVVSGTVASDCEGPLTGIDVALTDGDGTHVVQTASDGSFFFEDIARRFETSGIVSVTPPPGFDPAPDQSIALDVDRSGMSFTLVCRYYDVTGTVISDCHGPEGGIDVSMTTDGGTLNATTAPDGTFGFPHLRHSASTSTVSITPPSGYTAGASGTSTSFDLTQDRLVNFDLVCPLIDIAGAVSSDCEGPLADAAITLTDGDGASHVLQTTATGAYVFEGIRQSANSGTVSVTTPAGFDAAAAQSISLNGDLTGIDFLLPCQFGDVSGTVVSDCGQTTEGMTVTLYDAGGGFVGDTTAATGGDYDFPQIRVADDYSVLVLSPLGYASVTAATFDLTVAGADEDFILECIEVVEDARSKAFWKHNVSKHLANKPSGTQVTEQELLDYAEQVFGHFFENFSNPIDVLNVTYRDDGGPAALDLATMNATLKVKRPTEEEKAKEEYLALLLNVASGRLATFTVVSDDDRTCSQAITYIAQLLLDPQSSDAEYAVAKTLGRAINNSQLVNAGAIPDVADYAYRTKVPDALRATLIRNPVYAAATVKLALPQATDFRVVIYDTAGRRVRELGGRGDAGFVDVRWDGRNDHGRPVSPGIYLYRLDAGGHSVGGKMTLLR